MSEADYTGSGEESPLSYDSDNIDKDMDELITITRRTRKRDTSTAFSPVKEDDRKKACDHTPSLDHDTEPPPLIPGKRSSPHEGTSRKKDLPNSTPRTRLSLNIISRNKPTYKSTPTSRGGSLKRGYYSAPVKGSRASSSTDIDEYGDDRGRSSSSTPQRHLDDERRGHSSSSTPGGDSRASSTGRGAVGEMKGSLSPYTPTGSPKVTEELRDDSKILSEMHNMLHLLVKRVEGTEKELKQMKQKICSSNAVSKKKPQIPQIVRSETRKTYRSLVEEGEEFEGFDIGPPYTFKDDHNQACVRTLISEVQALNPSFEARDIRGAAYTYYKSLCQEESLQRRGIATERKKTRRRRERISRKLEERVSAFKKRRYEAKDQQKWSRILTTDFMSSEESGSEDGEEINVVMELPWRSSLVDEFFQSLDSQLMSEKSAKAKRQTKRRVKGQNSMRPAPSNAPGWALCV